MQSRYEQHGMLWIDLESPSREEVDAIASEFGIENFIAEELLFPSARPRTEFRERYVYLILHFPALRHSHKTREQEVDFIIGRDFLITAHYDVIDPLHKFSKIFEVNTVLEKSAVGDHGGYLFFFMLKQLYKAIEHEIEHVRHDLQIIEEHIFSDHQFEMVAAISRSSRDLLNLRQTIEPHRDVLHSLETDGAPFFGQEFVRYLHVLSNEYYRVHNHIMRNTESLHELRETNNSLLTTKQNETMKVFTILAFFTFPLSLMVEVFSTDAIHTPIIGGPFDFWIIVALLVTMASFMYLFFRNKHWL
jgi:magnesium transporter